MRRAGPTLRNRLWPLFEAQLFEVPGSSTLFNPYLDEDPRYDVPGAPAIRQANLGAYLDALTVPDFVLVAEAPGPNGARFSGVPLTSEAQLTAPDAFLAGQPTSIGMPLAEYSARIVHRALGADWARVLIWNTVPFHPHPPGKPRGIRAPTRAEVLRFQPLLAGVVAAAAPAQVLAVGRVAERALREIGVAATYLRHPSQGGARLFAEGLRAALGGSAGEGDRRGNAGAVVARSLR